MFSSTGVLSGTTYFSALKTSNPQEVKPQHKKCADFTPLKGVKIYVPDAVRSVVTQHEHKSGRFLPSRPLRTDADKLKALSCAESHHNCLSNNLQKNKYKAQFQKIVRISL